MQIRGFFHNCSLMILGAPVLFSGLRFLSSNVVVQGMGIEQQSLVSRVRCGK